MEKSKEGISNAGLSLISNEVDGSKREDSSSMRRDVPGQIIFPVKVTKTILTGQRIGNIPWRGEMPKPK